MKKRVVKRLSLTRETVRSLTVQSLAQAAGGVSKENDVCCLASGSCPVVTQPCTLFCPTGTAVC